MTIKEAENFYKQDKYKYELKKNYEFLNWYEEKIDEGYKPLMNITELQDLINKIVIWYEIKYPEKELEFYEGIVDLRFLNIKKMSKSMNLEQLIYRIDKKQYYLIKCQYRTGLGGCSPIYNDGKIIGYNSCIGFSVKRKNKQDCRPWELIDYRNSPRFLILANPISGEVNINYDLEDYVKSNKITINQLLTLFENKYKDELDFFELNECVYNYNIDLELRNMILQLVALKLIYSRDTIPERGYVRAKRFINEFNKKMKLNLNSEEIDKLIASDYKKELSDLENDEQNMIEENSNKLRKMIKIFNKKMQLK